MLTPEEERQFKEILYLLLERVRATKAAFYLVDPSGLFKLASQYGFARSDRLSERISRNHPLAEAIFERREPHFHNELSKAGKLASVMEDAASTRILTAPLYLDGRIVGILDVRDKAGRAPFSSEDLLPVTEILRKFAGRVRAIPRFAVATEQEESAFEFTNSPGSPRGGDTAPVPMTQPPGSTRWFDPATESYEPSPAKDIGGDRVPDQELSIAHLPTGTARTKRLVEETLATAGAGRGVVLPIGPSSREAGFYRLYLETCLHLPDVEIAAISSIEPKGGEVLMVSRRPVQQDVEPALLENLEKMVARSGAGFAMPATTFRPVVTGEPGMIQIKRSEIVAIQSSAMFASPDWVLLLSLLFRNGPGAEARDQLRNVHLLVKNTLTEIRGSLRGRETYRGLVNKLIEPGLRKYTALKTHSFNVGRMARKLALSLQLPAVEVEQITVAAILHDMGMRDLNYDELYTKRQLTEEELKLVKEHPRVGALALEDIPFPYPIVPLVRHHHERWDGSGYPDGLAGEDIPFGARLIHICEAFDAMTSPTSYRQVLSATQALEIMLSKGGTQFDPELVQAFRRLLETPS